MSGLQFNNPFNGTALLVLILTIQGCAVLTPSQVNAVGDFALAAENYSELPSAVIDLHIQSMFAENVYASASISDPGSAAAKMSKDVDVFLNSLHTSARADSALNVIDGYVKLLTKLSSSDFTQRLEEETEILATEIDGGVSQYNEVSGEDLEGFGAAVAEIVRAGGGVFIRYKQAEALKEAVIGAEPIMHKMAASVTDLMDLYICGAVDENGVCVVDDDGQQFPGFGELVETGLVDEYQGLLTSGLGNKSIRDVEIFNELLLKAKSIKPLAKRTRQAMRTFQAAHTKLYDKLQESQTLEGKIEEIIMLYGEIKSAQRFRNTIESQNISR
ncbi:hypothetical protein [Methyloprofundus sp.]|uniref:hypothetical protein n=1 Tax=Methyloprofundus sp. TaxID=2020875 RepID=UPI003D12B2FA